MTGYFKSDRFLSEFNGYQFHKKDENTNSNKREFEFGSHFSYKQICTELDKIFFHLNFRKSHYRANTEDFFHNKNGN